MGITMPSTDTAQEAFAEYREQAMEAMDTIRRSISAQLCYDPDRINWDMTAQMAHAVSLLRTIDEVIP